MVAAWRIRGSCRSHWMSAPSSMSSAVRRPPGLPLDRDGLQLSEQGQATGKGESPGPMLWCSQSWNTRTVDESTRDAEEPGAHCGGDGELSSG